MIELVTKAHPDEGWWVGKTQDGKQGAFPSNHVEDETASAGEVVDGGNDDDDSEETECGEAIEVNDDASATKANPQREAKYQSSREGKKKKLAVVAGEESSKDESAKLRPGESFEMCIDPRKGERLGVAITNAHDHHIQLQTVIPGGAAARACPRARGGDIITSINGIDVLSKPILEVQQMLATLPRPLTLGLHAEYGMEAPSDNDHQAKLKDGETFEMVLDIAAGNDNLGFTIDDGHPRHIQIGSIDPDGVAMKAAPRAKRGDIITEINGISVLSLPIAIARDMLTHGDRPLRVTLHAEHDDGDGDDDDEAGRMRFEINVNATGKYLSLLHSVSLSLSL